jgi:hypothetical protein
MGRVRLLPRYNKAGDDQDSFLQSDKNHLSSMKIGEIRRKMGGSNHFMGEETKG